MRRVLTILAMLGSLFFLNSFNSDANFFRPKERPIDRRVADLQAEWVRVVVPASDGYVSFRCLRMKGEKDPFWCVQQPGMVYHDDY